MNPTKPGTEPRDLVPAIALASELNEVTLCNGQFSYPNGLNIWEWAALKAIKAAHRRDSNREREKPAPAMQQPMQIRRPGEKVAAQAINWANVTATPNE